MWWDSTTFLSALTPKFYVALTGTSSLISGLILIFEWWYFRKYGTSFIEQVSLSQLGPWLGGGATDGEAGTPAGGGGGSGSGGGGGGGAECKVWRNPLALLRGAEYARLWAAAGRAPLTYYDMNLSAQEHQAWFCTAPGALAAGGAHGAAEDAMARAWREREPAARVAAARAALRAAADCAPALLLLAEEDAPTVAEADRILKRAWRAAETAWRVSAVGGGGAQARRDAAVLAHIKRRSAMCARRLGRLKDATRMFRELVRDAPPSLHALSLHENLIEVLLEQKAYADVQAVVARQEDTGGAPSAALLYTAALLRARAACPPAPAPPSAGSNAAPPPPPPAAHHPRSAAELAALQALRRAIEYNPHVPEYLLELRALTFPPEHVLRRGDSEAVAYAFFHLRHWRAADGALALLSAAWLAWGGAGAGCGACCDRSLLAARGGGGSGGGAAGGGRGGAPLLPLLPLAALAAAALLALLALHNPAPPHHNPAPPHHGHKQN